jgi:hypothetical protein
MARRRARDLERTYSPRQFAAKLRRLAKAVERKRPFTIRVAGETLRIPSDAEFNVEHERAGCIRKALPPSAHPTEEIARFPKHGCARAPLGDAKQLVVGASGEGSVA